MDTTEHRLIGRDVSLDKSHMMFTSHTVHISVSPEGTEASGEFGIGDLVDKFLGAATIFHEIGNGDGYKVVFLCKLKQFGGTHHRTIWTHDFAAKAALLQSSKAAEIYCEERVLRSLKNDYAYAFEEEKYPGAPEWHVHLIDERPFRVDSLEHSGELVWVHDKGYFYRQPDGSLAHTGEIVSEASHMNPNVIPIRGLHGQMPVLGFRFGNIAYITDMSSIEDTELEKLRGLKHLTLNTVSYHPHHSHFSLQEAVALAQRIGAEHTWLTHLSHTFPTHGEFVRELRQYGNIEPAYDGLVIED